MVLQMFIDAKLEECEYLVTTEVSAVERNIRNTISFCMHQMVPKLCQSEALSSC